MEIMETGQVIVMPHGNRSARMNSCCTVLASDPYDGRALSKAERPSCFANVGRGARSASYRSLYLSRFPRETRQLLDEVVRSVCWRRSRLPHRASGRSSDKTPVRYLEPTR